MSSYWGITICTVWLCVKLLGKNTCQGFAFFQASYCAIPMSRFLFCAGFLGEGNLQGLALLHLSHVKRVGKSRHSRRKKQGLRLLANTNTHTHSQTPNRDTYRDTPCTHAHRETNKHKHKQTHTHTPLLQVYNDYNLQGRFRFVIFLKHAKSVLDCGSSYI